MYEFSGSRAALYYEQMELDRIFERDGLLLLSRSSVLASAEVDFKQHVENVTALRDTLDNRLPYITAALGGKTPVELEREEMVRKYRERAERILGKEKVAELIKNGKL